MTASKCNDLCQENLTGFFRFFVFSVSFCLKLNFSSFRNTGARKLRCTAFQPSQVQVFDFTSTGELCEDYPECTFHPSYLTNNAAAVKTCKFPISAIWQIASEELRRVGCIFRFNLTIRRKFCCNFALTTLNFTFFDEIREEILLIDIFCFELKMVIKFGVWLNILFLKLNFWWKHSRICFLLNIFRFKILLTQNIH